MSKQWTIKHMRCAGNMSKLNVKCLWRNGCKRFAGIMASDSSLIKVVLEEIKLLREKSKLLCIIYFFVNAFSGLLLPIHEIFPFWQIYLQGYYLKPVSLSIVEIILCFSTDCCLFLSLLQLSEFFSKDQRCGKNHELSCS